ncbi:MAG: YcaO-like family protein [Syntrophobacteraceae bacterium]
MPGITIKDCPKVYIKETHRSREPASTLELVHRIRAVAGIEEILDITDCDATGIPAFICERIRPDGSKTTHTGKGLSPTQAQVSLIMEAIERYSSEYRDEYFPKLVQGSFSELKQGGNVLDPEELVLSRFSEYRPDDTYFWFPAYDLSSGNEILVPACEIFHPFALDDATLTHTHTNGLASGNTVEEAIFHALCELIERDAWSIAKFRDEPDDPVLVEDSPGNLFMTDLIDRFEAADIQVTAKDITSDIGVPVIAAFSYDTAHPETMVMDGFGAHLDPKVAMARALLELAVTRSVFLRKYGLKGLRESRLHEVEDEDNRFYCRREIILGEMPSQYTQDIGLDAGLILEKLRTRGFEKVIVADLTRQDAGLPVVRVIVPGLENYCFDRGRMGPRLLEQM